jgi:hypothetical protein
LDGTWFCHLDFVVNIFSHTSRRFPGYLKVQAFAAVAVDFPKGFFALGIYNIAFYMSGYKDSFLVSLLM